VKGYAGQILHVDLTTGMIEKESLDLDRAGLFIGAQGLDLRTAYTMIKPNIDPLSADNVIFFSAGPLVGTQLGTRCSSLTKNPLTGAIAFGSGGMGFGPRLKWAGYDQIIITGRASEPVFLRISDKETEICSIGKLWRRDIYETTDKLWEKLGRLYSVIVIGKTGENLVPISIALIDRTSSIGKGGLPAVMGSKNLKAVAVRGSTQINLADPEKFKRILDRVFKKCDEGGVRTGIKLGKMWMAIKGTATVGYKNYEEIFPREMFKKLYGEEVYFKEIMGKRLGCVGCPYPCKDLVNIENGEGKCISTNVSSLVGRVYNLGIQAAGGASFKETIKLIDVANRLGVDTQTFAPTMMLAVELYEKSIITKKDTEGIELRADFKTALTLLEKVAAREGIGDILAEGSLGIIRKFGKEWEGHSFHIKGLEQQQDARVLDFNMKAFCQVTNPEGGSLEPGQIGGNWFPRFSKGFSVEDVKKFCERMDMPERTKERTFAFPNGCYNIPLTTRWAEDFYVALTALGICEYRTEFLDWSTLAELLSSGTGIETTADRMKNAGERIWNLFKAINAREGFNRGDDRFPPRWLEPLKDAKGSELELGTCEGRPVCIETFDKMLDEYYEERGWDIQTSLPTKAKLEQLGLEDIAEDLHKRGLIL